MIKKTAAALALAALVIGGSAGAASAKGNSWTKAIPSFSYVDSPRYLPVLPSDGV